MNLIYAMCPVHGAFESSIFIANSTNVVMNGNVEPCPKCGLMSPTMSGTFNFRDGLVEVLSAPTWTKDLLRGVREKLADAKAATEKAESQAEVLAAIAQLRAELSLKDAKLDAYIASQTKGKSREFTLWFLSALLAVFLWAVPASDVLKFSHETINHVIKGLPEFDG